MRSMEDRVADKAYISLKEMDTIIAELLKHPDHNIRTKANYLSNCHDKVSKKLTDLLDIVKKHNHTISELTAVAPITFRIYELMYDLEATTSALVKFNNPDLNRVLRVFIGIKERILNNVRILECYLRSNYKSDGSLGISTEECYKAEEEVELWFKIFWDYINNVLYRSKNPELHTLADEFTTYIKQIQREWEIAMMKAKKYN